MTDNMWRVDRGGDPADKQKNTKTILKNYPGASFPIGLNLIDLGNQGNARLKTYVDNVKPADKDFNNFSADIHLDAWDDTVFHNAGVSWLDVSYHSTDFQFGTWTTGDCNGAYKVFHGKFAKPYEVPPQVIAWIHTIDIDKAANARVEAFATNVTTTGFELHVGTWHNETHVYDCHVSWVAVPTNRPNLTAGVVNTGELERDSPNRGKFTKDIKFDKAFTRVPHVAAALNKIDCSNQAFMRVETHVENVTPEGFTLVAKTWLDTVIYDCGVGYVVVGEF